MLGKRNSLRAALALVMASGCHHGFSARPVSLAGDASTTAAPTTDALRRAVALDPADRAARLALADDAAAHGRPSEAIREYQHVVQAGTLLADPLNAAQRKRFAGLLHDRGTLRSQVADAGALADLHAAQRAGATVTALELYRARVVEALWLARHADVTLQARGLTALIALSREPLGNVGLRCRNPAVVARPVRSGDAALTDARFQAITTLQQHADWHVAAWLWSNGARLLAGRMAVALADTSPANCQPPLTTQEAEAVHDAAQWWLAPTPVPIAAPTPPLVVGSEPPAERDAAVTPAATPTGAATSSGVALAREAQPTPGLARVLGSLSTRDVAELARMARAQPGALAQRAQALVDQQLDAEAASRTVGMILLAWVPHIGAPAMQAARLLLDRYAEPSADPQTTFVLALRFAIANDGAAAQLWATRAAAALGDPADVLVAVALATVDHEPLAALSLLRAAHGQPSTPTTRDAAAWARRVARARLHRDDPAGPADRALSTINSQRSADADTWLTVSWTAARADSPLPPTVGGTMPNIPAAWPAWFAQPNALADFALADLVAKWEQGPGGQLPRYAPALHWYALAGLARALLQVAPQ